jgi:hypothetical protein
MLRYKAHGGVVMPDHFLTSSRKNTINSEVIKYLTETRMPFLQVVGMVSDDYSTKMKDTIYADLESGAYGEPGIIDVGSWALQYWPKSAEYPPAICVSAGNSIINNSKDLAAMLDDESAAGTIQGQTFDVAAQIVLFAVNLQWDGIQIVDGSKPMQWATWAVANHNELPCYGYDESADDKDKAGRITEILAAKYTKDKMPDSSVSLSPHNAANANKDAKDKDKN